MSASQHKFTRSTCLAKHKAATLAAPKHSPQHSLKLSPRLCRGLLIGGVCMDPKQAQTVTTVVMLTFLLVGGFYVKDVPVWIGWIKYFSFIYWGEMRCVILW